MKRIKTIIKIIPYGVLVGLVAGYFVFGLPREDIVITEEKTVEVDYSLQKKTEELKQRLLDDLKTAEIKGYEHLDVVMVFDPLKKDLERCRQVGGVRLYCYSFGDYNFKIATVQYYSEKFNQYTPTDKEALDIALDKTKARELAYQIIFNEVGGIYNWSNSAKKINAIERINFIRELEQ